MQSKPMGGARGQINRAASEMPSERVKSRVNVGGVGRETPVSPKVVQDGGSAAEATGNPLRGAMKELKTQHPHPYTDHGPHHGGSEHIRHKPMRPGR